MNWNTNELQVLLSEHQGWSVESTEQSIVIQNEDGINAFLLSKIFPDAKIDTIDLSNDDYDFKTFY